VAKAQLQSDPSSMLPLTAVVFSILAARAHLPEHTGPYAGVLRYHLGLIVPRQKEACRIRVGSDVAHWEEGRSVVFDDTYMHEVWNDTDEERVVLFVDFARPLSFPVSLLNNAVIWLFGRTGYVQEIVENVDESQKPDAAEMDARIAEKAEEHGLLRRGGLAFFFPGRGTAVLNVTHIEAPLDPVAASRAQFDGRDQADTAIALLRSEFPKAFGEARVRAYGYPGRRQTRWIKGRHQLTTDQVRHGTWFEDAVARTAWPIELHDRSDGYVWEMFDPDHVHYVPLRAMSPRMTGSARFASAWRKSSVAMIPNWTPG